MSGSSRRGGPIYMTTPDMKRLMELVNEYRESGRQDPNLDLLDEEIHRALVMDAERRLASDVVTLDSRVVVEDLDRGKQQTFTIVMPEEANDAEGRISVLTPLAMAVLGYRIGQEIVWDAPDGRHRLMVRRVLHQPEAAARGSGPGA
jgi:regulator of nucleoside diphosphate kinase